jgi:hypothetical protein
MKVISASIALFVVFGLAVAAQHVHGGSRHMGSGHMHDMNHAAGAPVSYSELKKTVTELDRAREATAKYQDVRVAEAAGYQPVGPDVPGMGVHFVLNLEPSRFDIEKPPMLLYQKNAEAPGGYALVGVSYLWDGPEGSDGQPQDPPFPKALARWHRHGNICVLAHLENPHGLTEQQCRERGGRFIARSQWMVHAWIWKDNPAGVFTPENPALK